MSRLEEYFGIGVSGTDGERRQFFVRRTKFLARVEKFVYDSAVPLSSYVRHVRLSSGENAFLHHLNDTGTGYLVICRPGLVRYFFGSGDCFRNEEAPVEQAETFPVDRSRLIWFGDEFARYHSAVNETIQEAIKSALVSRHSIR